MSTVPDSLPGQIYLLAFDRRRGRLAAPSQLGLILRAAALADLQTRGLLGDSDGRVVVRHPVGTTGDQVLDDLLTEIASAPRPRRWGYWIARHARPTSAALRRQLVAEGWIRTRPRRWGFLPLPSTVTVQRPAAVDDLQDVVRQALMDTRPVSRVEPRHASLVALAAAGDLRTVLTPKQRRQQRDRVTRLTAVAGPVVPALHRAVASLQAAACPPAG